MQYRSFPGVPGLRVSTLGFGCMRLPLLPGGDPTRIDEDTATSMLHEAIEAGVNYVDTAYPYHGGASEPFVGRALAGGWRARVQLATKLPVWLVQQESDWERLLDEQLRRLDTDRIDFYLLHALAADRWDTVTRHRGIAAMERALADGRIGHLGFSFHGPLDAFKTIIDARAWEFCQVQFNYLDEHYQAGLEGVRYAADRGVGVIVMEPLRGGALASAPPPAVEAAWARSGRPWSPAEWALRWVWNHPEVVTALSGMTTPAHLRENLRIADAAAPLSADDLAHVHDVQQVFKARTRVPCTTCGYCQPCPQGVSIPDAFSLYNAASMFESVDGPRAVYTTWIMGHGAGADRCAACGECEPKCPQGIAIPERLQEAHAALVGNA